MGDRGDWVPIAAGVVVGAGILTLIYKMFFASRGPIKYNQQITAPPFKCTCKKGGKAQCQQHGVKMK